jgi:hypothetical protein
LTALRLTDSFVQLYSKSKNLSGKSVKESGITFESIFKVLPIKFKNSHLLDLACSEIRLLTQESFGQQLDGDLLSVEKLVEKQLESLIESVEDQTQEYWRFQSWYRGMQKEQQKVSTTLHKMAVENEQAVQKGGDPVHSEQDLASAASSPALQRSIAAEPSRLDTLLLGNRITTLSNQLTDLTVV